MCSKPLNPPTLHWGIFVEFVFHLLVLVCLTKTPSIYYLLLIVSNQHNVINTVDNHTGDDRGLYRLYHGRVEPTKP